MKKILILLALALFIVSCGSPANKNKMASAEVSHNAKVVLADKNSDEKVICKQIKKTGSHRITTVCEAQSDIGERREQTQRELTKQTMKGGPKKVGSKGF